MRIHSFLPSSSVNGPGDRVVIWFQGCELACPGCFNSPTHSFTAGESFSPMNLARQIAETGKPGVTFSGGEPLHQVAALADLMMLLKLKNPDISLGMYTGYSQKEASSGQFYHPQSIDNLKRGSWSHAMNKGWWNRVQGFLDFAVMGRFNQRQLSSLPLRASKNQTLELFSNRYTENDFTSQQVEFNISSEMIAITGFPTEKIYANA